MPHLRDLIAFRRRHDPLGHHDAPAIPLRAVHGVVLVRAPLLQMGSPASGLRSLLLLLFLVACHPLNADSGRGVDSSSSASSTGTAGSTHASASSGVRHTGRRS